MKETKELNLKFMIIAIICICLFVIAIVPRGLQNDTFYTIKLGELVLDNGIDMQEHFAWHEGLPYTYPHWLYDIGIYLIYNLSGYNGVYISSIILGMVLGICIYITNAKLTKNVLIPFFTTIFVLYIGADFITARAQLVTFILFVLTIYNIEKFLQTKKIKYAIALLIIPIIIANVHAAVFPFYFILYLPYIAEFIISILISKRDIITKLLLKSDEIEIKKLTKKEKLSDKEEKKLKLLLNRVDKNKKRMEEEKVIEPYKIIVNKNNNCKWLLLIMVIALLTGFITPIGDTPYTYLIHTMQGNTTENISEHIPIVLFDAKWTLGYITLFIMLMTFTKVKIKLSDVFLILGLTFLTIMSRRQESMLLFVGLLVVNKMICDLITMYDPSGVEEMLKILTSIIAKVVFFLVFTAFAVICINKSKDTKIVDEEQYPIEACKYIKENLKVENIRLYNEYNFGSYMLFQDIPVFIDSRADVYDPQFNKKEDDIFRDYINISSLNIDYEEKFEHYGITHLLIYKNSKLNKFLEIDSKYKELYSDKEFIVYERLV